ncbi:unnamed protein product [Linum tenue]|uniref:Myb-like domain-containing protein n=1 Tax=Linum tenue TaxID=586396 RepID=A0AAV0JTV3_9ROSI|nr:unnamed protein product [Linum tenue]
MQIRKPTIICLRHSTAKLKWLRRRYESLYQLVHILSGAGKDTFSSVEVENLVRGVERFGTGPWALIRDVYFSNSRRTNQDLWHKWRNLVEMKSADHIVTPQQLTRIAAANRPKLVALQEGYLEPVVEQEIDDLDVKTSVLTPTQRASIMNFVAQATVKTYLAHSELLDVMQLFDWFLVAKIDQGNDVAAEDYNTFHPLVVNLVNTTKAMMDNILDPIEGNTSNNNAGQDVDIADNVEEVATGSDSGAAIIVNEGVGATVSTSVATVGDGGNADTVEVATGSDDGAAIIVNEDVRATVSTSEATVGVDGGAATE